MKYKIIPRKIFLDNFTPIKLSTTFMKISSHPNIFYPVNLATSTHQITTIYMSSSSAKSIYIFIRRLISKDLVILSYGI